MIIIYSNFTSHRLNYTLDVIFKYVLGVDYKLTNNESDFKQSIFPKINYSNKKFDDSLRITPSKLLFQKGIEKQDIKVNWENDIPFFFNTNGIFSHDIFASTFYMVTRYEEYLPYQPDKHGRFKAEDSLAFQQGFLKKPVVNLWIACLQEKLQELFPDFNFPKKETLFINTLDIDVAYAYKAKGFVRFWGGLVKGIIKRDKADLSGRKQYLSSKKDPFDTYDFIKDCSENIKTQYFFLLGNRAEFDTNIHYKKKGFKKLILSLGKEHVIGIHPSYQSNSKPELLSKEIKRLEKILGENVTHSRQHFLKMETPNTYENLIRNGIYVDYTMGFASQIGFRAGICHVYPFYNLEKEEQRPLWIVPFMAMDGTLNQYLKLSPKEAIIEIKNLIAEVENVNGLYVSLWHNSSLSETDIWKGWKLVYKEMLSLMK